MLRQDSGYDRGILWTLNRVKELRERENFNPCQRTDSEIMRQVRSLMILSATLVENS